MRLRPYLTLLRGNPAFSRLFAAQLIARPVWRRAGG
jgi:hypothetical protein